MHNLVFLLVLLLTMLSSSQALAEPTLVTSPETCLMCHSDVVSADGFATSVHGPNGCVACHIDLVDVEGHMSGEVTPQPPMCVRCHKVETAEHYASVHMLSGIDCSSCHWDIHTHRPWAGDKNIASAKCAECHFDTNEVWQESSHGQAVMAGNMDSAACLDCHNLHAISEIGQPGDPGHWEFHTDACMKCHADRQMMERNNVMTVAVSSYLSSYHGKNYRLGYPDEVAGCANCHTSHAIFPHNDPRSTLYPENLIGTCGACHSNSSAQFVKFYSHGDMTDRENYPILWWTFVSMTTLLVSTFGVFWVHSLFWLFRGFVDNRQKHRAMIAGHFHVIPDAHKVYRRFTKTHIFLHLLVIISFLLLSMTGIPLKFADQEWAKVLMGFFGGAPMAADLHRLGAVITFVYFGVALFMSAKFLFYKLEYPAEFFQRLFGPESLCPNLRDIRDVTAMVRWFLFLGPKPTFERWTYWEKFDFIAVFWGMFAIGGSGLMLWFPEFFAAFLPGWSLNVATIIHSDEALLATGFIFTVHFFNTHGRPEKFPMDFVIFNGELSKEEFIEERADQWQRYEEAGILDQYIKEKPSGIAYDFIIKTFGFLALFIGLGLLVLMIYAFLLGGHTH
ncbi:MAG: cytochrome c3 family protein [Desulfuromonadales bacterium]|nr:cytochrome c3 family protein [Desulfuromonadales bacterium]